MSRRSADSTRRCATRAASSSRSAPAWSPTRAAAWTKRAIGEWCRQLAALARDGREVIMVSSGAIAEGMKRLGWTTRPHEIHELQAAAAVGQMGLAQMYETKLRENGLGSAQVLLTHADLADRERYLNARSTLLTLLRLRVRAGDQRERHGRQRRDQVRRQRHAGRAGRQPGRSRRAGDPHRPEGPVQRRPAQGPGGHASSTRRAPAIRRWKRWPAAPAPASAAAA